MPLVSLDNASLSAIAGKRWQVALYVNNNANGIMLPMIEPPQPVHQCGQDRPRNPRARSCTRSRHPCRPTRDNQACVEPLIIVLFVGVVVRVKRACPQWRSTRIDLAAVVRRGVTGRAARHQLDGAVDQMSRSTASTPIGHRAGRRSRFNCVATFNDTRGAVVPGGDQAVAQADKQKARFACNRSGSLLAPGTPLAGTGLRQRSDRPPAADRRARSAGGRRRSAGRSQADRAVQARRSTAHDERNPR